PPKRFVPIPACEPSTLARTAPGMPIPEITAAMLELRDVSTGYGRAQALFELSLVVGEGEVVVLLGRNGAGKSTTLKTIAGMLRPWRGEIIFKGERIEQLPPWRIAQRGIGYVPEERRIFTDLTVGENLEVGTRAPPYGAR